MYMATKPHVWPADPEVPSHHDLLTSKKLKLFLQLGTVRKQQQ